MGEIAFGTLVLSAYTFPFPSPIYTTPFTTAGSELTNVPVA